MDKKSCIEQLKVSVPDENVRAFIFKNPTLEGRRFLDSVEDVNLYYSNVMNLAFALIYSRFIAWKYPDYEANRPNEEDLKNKYTTLNTYFRLDRTFYQLYKEKSLSFSIIEPTIMDIQLDIANNGVFYHEWQFNNLFQSDAGHRFASFVRQASIYRTNPSRFVDVPLSQKLDDLLEFIWMFPFLQRIRLNNQQINATNLGETYVMVDGKKEPCNNLHNIVISTKSENIDTGYTLIKLGTKFFYLQNLIFETTESGKKVVQCNYAEIGSENALKRISVTNDEDYVGQNGEVIIYSQQGIRRLQSKLHLNRRDDDEQPIIKDFYSINYRYVKPLALSISDVLKPVDEKALRARFCDVNDKENYADLFDCCQKSWDTILAVLIVKESAINVLNCLFLNNEEIYNSLLDSIHTRLGRDVFDRDLFAKTTKDYVKVACDRWSEKYCENNNKSSVLDEEIAEQYKIITAEVRSMQLVEYISEILKINVTAKTVYKNNYPLNINSHKRLLEFIKESNLSLDEKKTRTASIVRNTLKVLYLFYCGFFKYITIKDDFNRESKLKVLTAAATSAYQKAANDAFQKEVTTLTKALNKDSLDIAGILHKLRELNNECSYDITTSGEKGKNDYLREYLGRHSLLDYNIISKLEEYTQFDDDNETVVRNKIKAILEIYDYLRDGKTSDSVSDEFGVDGIYPYVATYEYTHQTRDGYRVAHFSIRGAQKEIDVEVLSEFTYDVNEKYYCLPNKLCCGNNKMKLWIEPTMINYKHLVMIDEELRHNEMSKYFTFAQLSDEKDYYKTAELIYGTDPYIYHDLFGDRETACDVLYNSFDNPDCIFYKQYVYVVKGKKSGEVVGVALFHPKNTEWNETVIVNDFKKAGASCPESFEAVSQYLSSVYNVSSIGGSICNISISPNYRRRGIAMFALKNLLEVAQNETIELTVLKNNVAAINLYKKLGFKILGEPFMDYGGYNLPKVECYKMVLNRG